MFFLFLSRLGFAIGVVRDLDVVLGSSREGSRIVLVIF